MWLRTSVVVAAILAATSARADPCEALDKNSDAARDDAAKQQERGDKLYIEGKYTEALASYRAAVASWHHPKLQAAVGLTLMKLERWADAADVLEQALACGARGLDADLDKTRGYLATAVKRTGTIAIEATQAGASILLDGKQVFVAPGSMVIRVMPGEHVVIAKRSDATSEPVSVRVDEGQRAVAAPVLYTIDTRWRWSRWKPWTVTAGGVAIAGAGVLLLLSSRQLAQDFDRQFVIECPTGCDPSDPSMLSPTTLALRDRADSRGVYAGIALGTGGLIAATGLLLVSLNGEQQRRSRAPERFVVAPWGDARGVTVSISY